MNDCAKWITIATASQPMEAAMIQVALGSHDLDSQLDGEYTIAVDPLLSNAIGGVQVKVAPTDVARAREILAEIAREKREAESLEARTCPSCGSVEGEKIKKPNLIGILTVLTLGGFSLLFPWPKYKCPSCGTTWK
jgi:predicted RNA-binding Zn-ribbon protein involved in translation (DUF1610 family)